MKTQSKKTSPKAHNKAAKAANTTAKKTGRILADLTQKMTPAETITALPFLSKHERMIHMIRTDTIIGRGTCSTIDEANTDAELIERFGHAKTAREGFYLARIADRDYRKHEKEVQAA